MADITITPSGGVEIHGCNDVFRIENIPLKFGVGDIAFVKKKANRGVLERVAIRAIKSNLDTPFPTQLIVFFDTLNGRWLEADLLSHQEAIDAATAFLEGQIDALGNLEVCK